MKVWKISSGIISLILCVFALAHVVAVGIVGVFRDTGGFNAWSGLLLCVMLLSAGVVSIATSGGPNGGNIALIILYGIGAIAGYTGGGTYAVLYAWASWSLLCCVMAVIFAFSPRVNVGEDTVLPEPQPAPDIHANHTQHHRKSFLEKYDNINFGIAPAYLSLAPAALAGWYFEESKTVFSVCVALSVILLLSWAIPQFIATLPREKKP